MAEYDTMVRHWLDAGVGAVRVDQSSGGSVLRLGSATAQTLGVNGNQRSVAFDLIGQAWTADAVSDAIDDRLRSAGRQEETRIWSVLPPVRENSCAYHGERRDRAALLLALALPGSPYLMASRYRLIDPPPAPRAGHPGCELCALAVRNIHPDSLDELFRAAILTRSTNAAFANDAWVRRAAPEGVAVFERGGRLRVMVNLSAGPVPCAGAILLASEPVLDGVLGPDAAAWLAH
jgi:hypothetical protein